MRAYLTKEDIKRFWSHVLKTETCWLWEGQRRTKTRYAYFGFAGRTSVAHRVSWVIAKGDIPRGLFVLHNCPGGDNPACVNPEHLWLGTQKENMDDARRKGTHHVFTQVESSDRLRKRRGEHHYRAKLTEADVIAIRHAHAAGDQSFKGLARRYGVADLTIARIIKRRGWTHVP